jgi:hypothetical protein
LLQRFPSRARRMWQLAPTYVSSAIAGYRERSLFDQIETYGMFIGYPRSGHSLVGSLLDAHPDVAIAHELDALGFLRAGFSRNQLYALILNNSRQIAAVGRTQTGYDYVVPGGWQGRFRRLQVIGDKRGRTSMTRLRRHPELLDRLVNRVGGRARFIHVVRNPYDNISTISKRTSIPLDEARDLYFSLCSTVTDVKRRVPDGWVIDVRHEDLIADPKTSLKELCTFLRIAPTDAFLDGCASIVLPSPHRSRHDVPWPVPLRGDVERRIAAFRFLQGYSWET